jgi:indole-3-glycerol phosphate synthase
MSILQRIVEVKHREISDRSRLISLAEITARARDVAPTRGFKRALEQAAKTSVGVIAEIKQASPSKGLLRTPFLPGELAQSYQRGGASCLSVLTDVEFFQGADAHLIEARAACSLPVIRKDFCVSGYQVIESRMLGADAILLIAACLSRSELCDLEGQAREVGLDVLIEVHDQAELGTALDFPHAMLGINNRDLKSFETRIETTLQLLPLIPAGRLVISESGIHHAAQVKTLRAAGVGAFLIGEHFMRASDPGEALRALLEAALLKEAR